MFFRVTKYATQMKLQSNVKIENTLEQKKIINHLGEFRRNSSKRVLIKALAGTGKTHTLKETAERIHQRSNFFIHNSLN